jgi:integrase
MSRRRGNITQRSPGSFRLRYDIGRDPVTGKRRMATTTVRGTRKDAERELTRLLRTIDTGEHVDPSRMTVREWFGHWLETVRPEVSPKTHERYSEILSNYLVPTLGNVVLVKLTPNQIQKAYNVWALKRRDGKSGGLSPTTRRHIHRILKSSLKRAVEQQALARNPAAVIRPPKSERREMTALSAEQSVRFLEAISHHRLYWPSLLALATGMRRGEILALRWKHVDLDRGVLRVMESLEQIRGGIRFKPPKSGRTRSITIPAFAVEKLRRLRLEQAEELLRVGVRQTGDTLVICREDGEPKWPDNLTSDFVHLVARMKDLPRVRFHDLRHSHATQLLIEGVHPKVAQERLGHASVAMTLDVYSHVVEGLQSDAADRLNAAWRRR